MYFFSVTFDWYFACCCFLERFDLQRNVKDLNWLKYDDLTSNDIILSCYNLSILSNISRAKRTNFTNERLFL